MIHETIDTWHEYLSSKDPEVLDGLLADDVVFISPVVFTPQEGKEITKLYLLGAAQVFPGDDDKSAEGEPAFEPDDSAGKFRYTKKVFDGDTAVLEFETTVSGKYVNGVDIIRVNSEGKIVEFRVMIRPLQAVKAVHAQMKAALETMGG